MSRCICCDMKLDLVNKEGWDDGMCRTCVVASFNGCIFTASDKLGESYKLSGFEAPDPISDPLGTEYGDSAAGIFNQIELSGKISVDFD